VLGKPIFLPSAGILVAYLLGLCSKLRGFLNSYGKFPVDASIIPVLVSQVYEGSYLEKNVEQ